LAPSAGAASTASSGATRIRNLGRRPLLDDAPDERASTVAAIADAPMPREDVGARDQVEPILHTVQSGENFWTISRLYYNSGRYYRALHAANRRTTPNIRELYVGTTIKVPPLESLDVSLFDPPPTFAEAGNAAVRRATAHADADALGAGNAGGGTTRRRSRGDVELGMPASRAQRPGDQDADDSSRPIYKVKVHDTLRSIARDTLGDSHRYREILDLNRDVIDDPTRLVTGQNLTLPEDATIGRRLR
jgi:nucleoid-associated protein YgaU